MTKRYKSNISDKGMSSIYKSKLTSLPNHQIIRVISRSKKGDWLLRPLIGAPLWIVPEGCYVPMPRGLLLPKRKRGEKFVVHYTEIKEAIL